MNVLSLFDGISCGYLALDKAGIHIDKYCASEINARAIQISKYNHRDIQHIGDVCEITTEMLDSIGSIDLLIGGSPCQGLSSINVWAVEKGLKHEASRLFWEYARIYKYLKSKNPNLNFLLENVGSASVADRKIITEQLGVEGVKFNSQLVSAQNRNRVYWTNIPFEVPTERKPIYMQDILEDAVADKYYLTQKMYECIMSQGTKGWQTGKLEIDLKIARPVVASMHKMHRADTDNYVTTTYAPENKTNVRRLTPIEAERLQTIPDNYTAYGLDGDKTVNITDTVRYQCVGNGWTVDVIAHILRGLNK